MRIKIVVLSRGRSAPALRPFFFCCTCVYSASVSPHSQSIDTERALARVRSSASQTCLWFFSIREIIKGSSPSPIAVFYVRGRPASSEASATPGPAGRAPRIYCLGSETNSFPLYILTYTYLLQMFFIQFIDFTMKPDIMLTRIDVKYPF